MPLDSTSSFLPTRRDWLQRAGCGFAHLAFAGLAAREGLGATPATARNPLAAKHGPLPARAKRVIFLFMQGGPSHVDSFDYKPELIARGGTSVPFFDSRTVANTGDVKATEQTLMKPLWKFSQHGQSGLWASDLFPRMASLADDLCLIRSMHTEGVAHGPSTLFLHCGATNFIRPSMGSWITYGLGTENENLPGFISISPSTGNGGPRNYGNAFLPAVYQGTPLGSAGRPASEATIRNLVPSAGPLSPRKQYDLLQALNAEQAARRPGDAEIDAVIRSYELAWRMQAHAPEVLNVDEESAETKALYGIGEKETDSFGRQCLLARRFAESGVRYIQVTYGDNSANPAWDQHSNLPKHGEHAARVDNPIAGLLQDLKRRGLLEDTLVWWGAEFGRTPYAQKNGTGRDHNPTGFTTWLAGAGVKPGYCHGETDEFGHSAVSDKVHMHDLHATILHLLGLDHEQLTYRFDGRNYRLTDVHGQVVREILT